MASHRVDVIVLGAGAMGACTAWWLARRGRSVALLERFEPGHRRGSSHGATRIFRFAYGDPDYVRLAMDALPLWREAEDDTGEELLVQVGSLDHGDPAAIDAIEAALTGCGARSERLSPAAAQERWPHMAFDRTVLFSPDGGRCLADRTVRAFQERAAELGADVRFGLGPVALAEVGADRVVARAGDDEWIAPVCVVTVGGWAGPVLADLVPGLPTLVVELAQVAHFPPRPTAGPWPSFLHYEGAATGAGDFSRYGMLTPGEGVKVGGEHLVRRTTADGRSFAIDPDGLADLVAYAERWLPGVDPTPGHTATCLFTMAPRGDFVLDRVGPIVVGSPCSGHGFKFVPAIGRILADLADGTRPRGPLPRWALAG